MGCGWSGAKMEQDKEGEKGRRRRIRGTMKVMSKKLWCPNLPGDNNNVKGGHQPRRTWTSETNTETHTILRTSPETCSNYVHKLFALLASISLTHRLPFCSPFCELGSFLRTASFLLFILQRTSLEFLSPFNSSQFFRINDNPDECGSGKGIWLILVGLCPIWVT